jgi:hypothetical protein
MEHVILQQAHSALERTIAILSPLPTAMSLAASLPRGGFAALIGIGAIFLDGSTEIAPLVLKAAAGLPGAFE